MKLSTVFLLFFTFGSLVACDSNLFLSEVSAINVTNRSKLKSFVKAAKKHYESDSKIALEDFRNDPKWKKDSTYIFIVYKNKTGSLFNAAFPERDNFYPDSSDSFTTPLDKVISACKKGDNWVEYNFKNPAQEDQNQDSKKVSYVIETQDDLCIGSGIYIEE